MYKYVVLCLCVSLSGVLCYLNKEEGAECEWEGLKGKCVKETRCLTTLDESSPKHPLCSRKGGESIICCTDCQLVDNTKNAVFSSTSGLFWKDGRKARDSCLQYLEDLPYQCKKDGFYGGISRVLDEENKCYTYDEWNVEGEPAEDTKPSVKYPYRVMLGMGDFKETALWNEAGFIISDSYIITSSGFQEYKNRGVPQFVAVGLNDGSDSPSTWQIRKIKRFIAHPEYQASKRYHDIALIETDEPMKFDENVLPACLHVEENAFVENALIITVNNSYLNRRKLSDTIRTKKVEEISEQECKAAYGPKPWLEHGYNHTIQMCYGLKSNKTSKYCSGWSGEPLMITTQFSSCVHTAIGITAMGFKLRCGTKTNFHEGYTRIAYYVPWIESIVWP